MIELPTVVRNRAIAAGAERWIDELSDLVAGLAADWEIEIGALFDEGTEALVTEAVMADGTPAILKVLVPAARESPTTRRPCCGSPPARDARSSIAMPPIVVHC